MRRTGEGEISGPKAENEENESGPATPTPKSYLNNEKINIGKAKGLYDTAPIREKVLKWQKLGAAATAKAEAETTLRKPKSDVGLQRQIEGSEFNSEVAEPRAKSELVVGEAKYNEAVNIESSDIDPDSKIQTPKKRVVSDEHWLAVRTPKGRTDSPKKQPQSGGPKLEHTFYTRPGSKKVDAWVRRKPKVEGYSKPVVDKKFDDVPITVRRKRSKSQPAYVMRRAQFEATEENLDSKDIPLATEERQPSDHPLVDIADDINKENETAAMGGTQNMGATPRAKGIGQRPSPRRAVSGKSPLEQRKILLQALYPFSGLKLPPEPVEPSPEEPKEWRRPPPNPPKPGRVEAWINQTSDPFTEDVWDSGMPRHENTIRRRRMRRAKTKSEDQLLESRDSRDSISEDSRSRSSIQRESESRSKISSSDDQYHESSEISPPSSPSLKRSGARRHNKSPRIRAVKDMATPNDGLSPVDETSAHRSRETSQEDYFSKPTRRAPETRSRFHNTFGRQPLSTIASVETFDVHTGTNGLDRSASDAKRKVASHADLISVLSMHERDGQSLVSAHTIRTSRNKIGSASLKDIMGELCIDEVKYLRELHTAVDGVIPVLLSSIIQKSDTSSISELIRSSGSKDNAMTAIVNIGVALERLKSAHNRIPTSSPEAFLLWASSSHRIYADYIKAWRMGFNQLVVDLAPADASEGTAGFLTLNEASKTDGKDVATTSTEGEKVDVAFALKRPLVRLRHLARILKAIESAKQSEQAKSLAVRYDDLVLDARRRQDEERARLEDEAASSIDPSRAREVLTLLPLSGVKVDQSRFVRARDLFDLKLLHSSGQRLDCRVELILRDDGFGKRIGGDLLICEVEDGAKWLLFPPLSRNLLSARQDESKEGLVIMIRGYDNIGMQWHELLSLTSTEPGVQKEWSQMLGASPMPPTLPRNENFSSDQASLHSLQPSSGDLIRGPNGQFLDASEISIPIGEKVDRRATRQKEKPSISARPISLPAVPKDDWNRAARQNRDYRPRYNSRSPSPAGSDRSRSRSSDGYTVWFPENESGDVGTGRRRDRLSRESARDPYRDYHGASSVADRSFRSESSTGLKLDRQRAPRVSPRRSPLDLRGVSTPNFGVISTQTGNHRRSSSPLKHEYEPSISSDGTSARGDIVSDDDYSVTSESSVDEVFPDPLPPIKGLKRADDAISVRSPEPTTLGPSESASQAPYRTVPHQEEEESRTSGMIYSWSDNGSWILLHPNECSLVVSPGLIEAFDMALFYSNHKQKEKDGPTNMRPLIAVELTPLVPLRRGTALDISIRSPPTSNSVLRSGNNIMLRSRTSEECEALYNLINRARINNPTFIALQNARGPFVTSNWASYMDKQASERSRGSWWRLGSKGSYRADSARRTVSVAGESESSVASMSSAISALKRFTAGSRMFNVAKSSLFSRGGASRSTFSSSTGSSAPAGFDLAKGTPTGMSNTKIRIYERESASKWRDMGSARLSILHPPRPLSMPIEPGAILQEKRILISGKTLGETILDVTLGEAAFERVARTGLALSVWEQRVGLNGEVGQAAKTGGVLTARVRVYMIQMKSEAEAAYAYSLVGRVRY